jgi:hypothetical protein
MSIAAAAVTAAVTVAGLAAGGAIYGLGDAGSVRGLNEAVTLLFAVPVLVTGMVMTRLGKPVGLLVWSGMLYYFAYNYIPFALDMPVGILLVPHLSIAALSLWAMILLLVSLDFAAFAGQVETVPRDRGIGAILIGLALFVFAYQAADVAALVFGGATSISSTPALLLADFVMAVPTLFAGGILVWKGRPAGIFVGGAMLFAYGALSVGVLALFGFQVAHGVGAVTLADAVAVALMVVVCAPAFVRIARRRARDWASASAAELPQPEPR